MKSSYQNKMLREKFVYAVLKTIFIFLKYSEKIIFFKKYITAWKASEYGVFSGPYFPVFGPEKIPHLDTFHTVHWNMVFLVLSEKMELIFFCCFFLVSLFVRKIKNGLWKLTKFSPKRGSRNYKKNYANITFFHNN